MKKVSTAAVKATKNFSQPKLTIGLDLGDRWSWYCLLDEVGEVLQERKPGHVGVHCGPIPNWIARSCLKLLLHCGFDHENG
jgi:hypothetical protein